MLRLANLGKISIFKQHNVVLRYYTVVGGRPHHIFISHIYPKLCIY